MAKTFVILLFLFSCSSFQKIDPSKTYRHDLIIKSNDKVFEGCGVVDVNTSDIYPLEVESRSEDLDVFTVSSCSKFLQKEKAWNTVVNKSYFGGLWKRDLPDKTKIQFSYNRSSLEREKEYCPVRLESITKKDGVVAWGMIVFADPAFKNSFWLSCNDSYKKMDGVGICQNLVDNFVEVNTEEKTRFSAASPECSVGISEGKTFQFRLKKGYCTYRINSLESDKKGVLTTIGFEDAIVR